VRGAVVLTVNFYRVALLTTVLEKLKTATVINFALLPGALGWQDFHKQNIG